MRATAVVRTARVLTVGLVAVAVVVSTLWVLSLAWLSAWARVDATGPASTPELLTLGAASVAIAIAAWLCLGVALEVLSHLPGRMGGLAGRWADRLTPTLARRVAAFVLGVGVGVAGGPSQAVGASRDLGSAVSTSTAPAPGFQPTRTMIERPAPASGSEPTTRSEGAHPAPSPGFRPAPQRGTRQTAAEATPPPAVPGFTPSAPLVRKQADPTLLGSRTSGTNGSDVDEVVVHRGDTLWSIAAAHLGPDAVDVEVARAWPRWFEANRDVIGDDPHLVRPGQVLRVPDPSSSAVR